MINKQNKFNFDAVIWDLDGTITDTEYTHAQTEVSVLKKYGINISQQEIVNRFSGVKLKIIFEKLFEEYGVKADVQEACELKWKTMEDVVRKNIPKFMPGAKELLEKLHENNIKMALATSSIKSYVNFLVDTLKIRDKFNFIITGNEVVNGKPDPEIFVRAAKAIEAENEKCIVIEDGNAGVLAAQSANMKCIAAGDHIDKSILKKTSIFVDTLEKVDIDFINRLF